jgi:hypothetical protein
LVLKQNLPDRLLGLLSFFEGRYLFDGDWFALFRTCLFNRSLLGKGLADLD